MGRGPYYSLKDAAHYCGYKSVSHFRDMIREYHVPAKGPKENKYAEADLDLFMEKPRAFLEFAPQRSSGKRKRLRL